MVRQIWVPLGQIVHIVSSPEAFHPTRCCPQFATSAQSNTATILYLGNLCNRDSITSAVYTIFGNTPKVLPRKWWLGGTETKSQRILMQAAPDPVR